MELADWLCVMNDLWPLFRCWRRNWSATWVMWWSRRDMWLIWAHSLASTEVICSRCGPNSSSSTRSHSLPSSLFKQSLQHSSCRKVCFLHVFFYNISFENHGEWQGDGSDLDSELNNELRKQIEDILEQTINYFTPCLPSNRTKIRITAVINSNSLFG